MILFDEMERRERGLLERYGLQEGENLMPLPYGWGRSRPDGRNDLVEGALRIRGGGWLRQVVNDHERVWETPTDVEPAPDPLRPRLFVSHRQGNRECALRVAWLADQAGFDVWIDVWNPLLSDTGGLSDEKAIAAVIEMALLNSTHLCAVYTDDTRGSEWVPYEYGRVKDKVTMSRRASCCLHPQMKNAWPAWAHLGETSEYEPRLRQWLDDEWRAWSSVLSAPTGDWPPEKAEPQRLWGGC